jgi:endonuclease G
VFDDAYDVEYREGVLVPMRFWKIAVWAESKRLKAIALIADQKPVLEKLTEGVPEGFDWEVELERVSEFLTTVSEIERLTKLDFGTLRDADIRKGEEGLAQAADHPQILRSTDVPAGIAGKARTRQKP